MTAITKLLSSQAIDDTVRAFRTAIRVEKQEIKWKQVRRRESTCEREKDLIDKQIAQAEHELSRLHFSFGKITGRAFDTDLNLHPLA